MRGCQGLMVHPLEPGSFNGLFQDSCGPLAKRSARFAALGAEARSRGDGLSHFYVPVKTPSAAKVVDIATFRDESAGFGDAKSIGGIHELIRGLPYKRRAQKFCLPWPSRHRNVLPWKRQQNGLREHVLTASVRPLVRRRENSEGVLRLLCATTCERT